MPGKQKTREHLLAELAADERRIADLTDRLAGLERADGTRSLLTAIVESSDDAIISKTLDGIITSWNRGAERIFGYTPGEAVGRPVTLLIPPERLDEEPPIVERLRRGERVDHYPTVRIAKDGRRVDVSVTISPIRNARGDIVGASKIARDITEQGRAERDLRASREWLKVALTSIGDAVIAADTEARVTFINPIAQALTGWTEQEALGAPLGSIFHIVNEETRREVESPIDKVLREGNIVGLANHTVLIDKHGKERPIDDSGAPIKDAEGNILGAILVFRDVTQRREADRERTGLLAQEQEARRFAEVTGRLKDEFLATVSHELRTPLTATLGWVTMLRAGKLDQATAAKALATIDRNIKSQAQLVEDLLDISRIITGKIRIEPRPLYPASLIGAAVDALRPTAELRGIRVRTVLDSSAGPVMADAERLQQVIWNLLANAIKFTPRGGQVTIGLEVAGQSVEIGVTDTGRGITREFLPFVFERFTQADSSFSRAHGGLGMGLAIARSLVELHGGTIQVESAGEGKGASFAVRLPIAHVEGAAARPAEKAAPPEPHAEELEGLRLLVVDDELDTCEMLREVLERSGAEVRTATSAAEALPAMDSWRPHILLSDIGMPGQDGYDLITKIRARPADSGGNIPAIALTAFARIEDRMKALSAGYHMHVAKPVQPDELVAIVGNLAGLLGDRR
jgi:PAS domain S-box-containing protein